LVASPDGSAPEFVTGSAPRARSTRNPDQIMKWAPLAPMDSVAAKEATPLNEKWTFLILSDEAKNPTGIRITLEDRDSGRQASMQLTHAGEEAELTAEAHDYEAMEWKVIQIIDAGRGGNGGEAVVGAAKDHLRKALAA
jgi:hypothetical protein